MGKVGKIISTSSVLVICGTVLAINGLSTWGLVIIGLGISGAIINSSISYNQDAQDRLERKQLYENVAQQLGNSISSWPSSSSDQIH